MMWNNVGSKPRRRTVSEVEEDEEDRKFQRMSVDCTSSSRGLFGGIFLTVAAIISIIAFYVMVRAPSLSVCLAVCLSICLSLSLSNYRFHKFFLYALTLLKF